jgi:osmoprotectant transport system ATP-binding protein
MSTRSSPSLKAVGVSKTYPGGVEALDAVDLVVRPGETVALVGESGCGKSTLMRLFNRMEEPTAGEVHVRGQRAAELDVIALRRSVGYVQQEGGLLPHWTVRANVELVPRLLRWPAQRRRECSSALLELVGLPAPEYAERYPRELSGGQRQRVAFARAIASDPDIVLLDEPFAALDALTRAELQDHFLHLKDSLGKTFLLVTHDLGEAFRLADRVAVMQRGRIVRIATPEELRDDPGHDYVRDLLRHLPEAPLRAPA